MQDLDEAHPGLATRYNNLAVNLAKQGRYVEAESLLRRALDVLESTGGGHALGTAKNNLASNLAAQGRFAEAHGHYVDALEIMVSSLGENHPETARAYANLGTCLAQEERYDEAETFYRRALAIREATLGETHPDLARSYLNLGGLLLRAKRHAEAESLVRRAAEIMTEALGANHPQTADGLEELAHSLQGQGRVEESEPLYRRVLEIRRARFGDEHPATAEAYGHVATALAARGRFTDAELFYRRAVEIQGVVLPEGHPDRVSSHASLSYVLSRLPGRSAEALLHARSAVASIRSPGRDAERREAAAGETAFFEWRANRLLVEAAWQQAHAPASAAPAEQASERADIADLMNEAFGSVQNMLSSTVASVAAQMAARFASRDGADSTLVRQHQDVVRELVALDQGIVSAWGEGDAEKAERFKRRSAEFALDVEWLILSACNTAAADGTPGADGLSGLARAFMYAGARALLVSHWRVRDDVTARLTVETIRRSAETGSKAEALRDAMTAIRTGRDESGHAIEGWDPSWAHPSAWAPFVLVGGTS